MRFLSRQFFRRLLARVKAWKPDRRAAQPLLTPALIDFAALAPSLHREVTPNGVRVYGLCGCCGARMNASATLCEECAQKRRPARPI